MKKSIVTNYTDISAFSGRPAECTHHLVYGNGLHKLADADLLTIPLMHCEHNMSPKGSIYQIHGNPAAEALSKMVGQLAFERKWLADKLASAYSGEPLETTSQEWMDYSRAEFRTRYGRSYL